MSLLVLNLFFGLVLGQFDNVAQNGINFMDIARLFKSGKASTVNPGCAKQLMELIHNGDVLVKMADSWSKFPYSGLAVASRTDFGHYDECVAISTETGILGKHCTYGLVIPDPTYANATQMINNGWKLSYCVPHLCTANDLQEITKLPLFNDLICSTSRKSDLDFGTIFTVGLYVLILWLIIASTMYDLLRKSPITDIYKAFSVYTNWKMLTKSKPNEILCFHGIKFVSIWWIMAGHNAVSFEAYPVVNNDRITDWQKQMSSAYLMTGHLAVDSFFFISGFLLGYLYFKNQLSKKGWLEQIRAVPAMVLHRYLRLTPAVLMTYLFVVYLFKYSGSGPLFSYKVNGALTDPCKSHWWAVFLYIQNYYIFILGEELCITPLWYLCADMQLFLVAPLVLIPIAKLHKKSFKRAMLVLLGLNIVFVLVPVFSKLNWRKYDANFSEYDAQSRLSGYFIGATMGIYLQNPKTKSIKLNKFLSATVWLVVVLAMLGVVLVTQNTNINYGYVAKTLCYSFSRPVWSLGLGWIVFACFTGHGGFINWLLSNDFMQFGGKISYCLYLVHGPIITHFALTNKVRRYFSDFEMFHDWCGHFVLSTLVATVWTLAFELPMIAIGKFLFSIRARNK